jgi:Uri superfamily endonuclease
MTVFTEDYTKLPAVPGAYILIVDLPEKTVLTIRKFKGTVLEPGQYAYFGSARGPGGIKARCRRHLRKDKKIHWHIDHLTTRTSSLRVAAIPGGNECQLASSTLADSAFEIPVPGFGSSDCKTCKSHLFRINPKTDMENIVLINDDITLKAG